MAPGPELGGDSPTAPSVSACFGLDLEGSLGYGITVAKAGMMAAAGGCRDGCRWGLMMKRSRWSQSRGRALR